MSDLNRRDLLVALTALAATTGTANAQETAPSSQGSFGASRVLTPELTKGANGAERWNGPSGTLGSGEAIGMHVSVVPAGTPAVALHRIQHSEVIVVQEGTLEYTHDGTTERAPAGSIIYVAFGTNHFVKNAGSGPARYVVLQVGGDTKKS